MQLSWQEMTDEFSNYVNFNMTDELSVSKFF